MENTGLPLYSVLAGSFVALFLTVYSARSRQKGLPYPPGPPPHLIWGNALQIPKHNLAHTFQRWGKDYGSDILHASALGKHIIVLNSRKMAEDLLEERAAIYSDRPYFPVVELMGWDSILVFMGYDNFWRYHRKIYQQNFNKSAALRYWPMLLEGTHKFLKDSLDQPDKIWEHIKIISVSSGLSTMYGYTPTSLEDPVVRVTEEVVGIGSMLLTAWVNYIPLLKYLPEWVPGTSTNRLARSVKNTTEEIQRIPTEVIERQFAEGTARPSLMTDLLEKKATVGVTTEEEEAIKRVAWTVYGAASDTTVGVLEALMYILVQHPEVQQKAQQDIDRVVGHGRLPNFTDRQSLPYVEAVYRELMRHSPVAPTGFAHAMSEDDIYEGCFLPKGSTVFANIWAMTHNEDVYPQPHAFKPERFLHVDGSLNDDDRILAYGFGRRICVGKDIASASIWLVIASVVACFDLTKVINDSGTAVEINDEYIDCLILMHKKHFKFNMKPRSENAIRLIIDAATRI